MRALEREKREENKAVDRFEQAAGSWPGFDAESFVAEVYAHRGCGERAVPEW